MKRATVSADREIITVHIPMTFRKRGGRKLVVTPDGATWAPRPRIDNAMVKALARAFRWRKMLDTGVYATLVDLAKAKGVAPSYVSRVLRLTLLVPEIVEAILDGRQRAEVRLNELLEGFLWDGRARSKNSSSCSRSSAPGPTAVVLGVGADTMRPAPPTFPSLSIRATLVSEPQRGSMAELRARPPYSYRDDPAVPRFDDGGPVAIMDGDCALCASGARMIARLDRQRAFRIGRTQSATGAALVRHYGLEPEDPETWLFIDQGRAWSGMEAIIRIGARLGGPGRLLGIMRLCPRSAREWLYRRIAYNRYRFGRTDMCALPDKELRARLLE